MKVLEGLWFLDTEVEGVVMSFLRMHSILLESGSDEMLKLTEKQSPDFSLLTSICDVPFFSISVQMDRHVADSLMFFTEVEKFLKIDLKKIFDVSKVIIFNVFLFMEINLEKYLLKI